MRIKPEEEIDFLDIAEFRARKIMVVSDEFISTTGGSKHVRARGYARGNAYCYEVINVKPK